MASTSEGTEQANRTEIDPSRVVVIFAILAVVAVGLFLEHVLGLAWARFGWPDPILVEGLDWRATSFVAYAIAIGTAVALGMNLRTRNLSLEVASELMRVTWPSGTETRASTFAVIVASVIAAVILFSIDTIAFKVMVEWLPRLWEKMS